MLHRGRWQQKFVIFIKWHGIIHDELPPTALQVTEIQHSHLFLPFIDLCIFKIFSYKCVITELLYSQVSTEIIQNFKSVRRHKPSSTTWRHISHRRYRGWQMVVSGPSSGHRCVPMAASCGSSPRMAGWALPDPEEHSSPLCFPIMQQSDWWCTSWTVKLTYNYKPNMSILKLLNIGSNTDKFFIQWKEL